MKLPPVRKRTDYSGVKPDDLVFALFHDRIMPVDALSPGGEARAATKALDDWDDGEIDTWDDEAVKHMPGGHDQRSHGRSTGRRTASRSAYSSARASGATVDEARTAARTASQYLARAQRIENILKQQQGYMSPAQRRSSEAELDRLAQEQDAYLAKVPPHLHGAVNDAISKAPVTTPTVRGRQDPRGQQHSAAARDAHRRMVDIEGEIDRQKEPIRDKRRRNWDKQAELMEQRNAHIKSGGVPTDPKVKAIDRQLRKLDKENKALAQQAIDVEIAAPNKILHVNNPAKVELRMDHSVPKERHQQVETAVHDAALLTSTRGLDGRPVGILMQQNVRAHAQDYGDGMTLSGHIMLSHLDGAGVIAHELGHHVEYRNPEVKRRATEFLNRRTRGETPQPLAVLTGDQHYRADEIATPDRFMNPYMGKRYAHGATEIVSMGLEYMFADPVGFAKQDPDYFMFMYDVLRVGG